METIEFKYAGTLAKPENLNSNDAGVYIFTYKNDYEKYRIIYVGQSTKILKRLHLHKTHMINGRYTLWNPNSSEDVYKTMEKKEEKYYRDLLKIGEIWMPIGIHHDIWENIWKEKINKYIEEIQILFMKPLNVIKNDICRYKLYESLIQASLINEYKISYYIQKDCQSWLGKQERCNEELKIIFEDYKIEFNNVDGFEDVMNDLNLAIQEFLNMD